MRKLFIFILGILSWSSAIAFKLHSESFMPFTVFGDKYICFEQSGENISPQLSWTDVPLETQSLLLFVHDPDAPRVRGVGHWVVYIDDIHITSLKEGQRNNENKDIVFGLNERNENLYVGSCPPLGSGIHRYNFTLYALKTKLNKEKIKTLHQNELINLYSDKIIAQAVLTGFYKNKAEPVISK